MKRPAGDRFDRLRLHRPSVASAVGACLLVVALWSGPARGQAQQPVTVAADSVSATFDPGKNGAVVSLKVGETEFVTAQSPAALFELQLCRKGEPAAKRFYLRSTEAARCAVSKAGGPQQGRTVVTLKFDGPADKPYRAVCTVTAQQGDPLLRWRLELQIPETLVLESVRFPNLSLRAPLGGGGEGDAAVFGATKGGIYRNPAAWAAGRSVGFNQPSNLAAGFACYYNDDVGLLSAMFDPRGYPKSVNASRTSQGLGLSWSHLCYAGGNWSMDYDAVLGGLDRTRLGHAVDWRDSADVYKQWATRQPWCVKTLAERNDLPAWLTQGPAMVRFSREWLNRPEKVERWLKDYWQGKFPAGTPLIIAYWGWEKVGTWITPDYFPCYPTDEVFARLVRAGKGVNGHAFLWPSGYHYTLTYDKKPDDSFVWDDRARFESTAKPHAVVGRDGNLVLRAASWLRGGECATMCPGDPYTIDWFNHVATEIVRRGGELVQVDQVVGGSFPQCYSMSHAHAPGSGLWRTEVFHKQLKTMLAECRKIDPNAIVCFEEPNEWFLQEIGIQDYRDTEAAVPPTDRASVFNYLYHEYVPTFQSNPRGNQRLLQAWCAVNGQIPHLVPALHLSPEPLLLNGGFEESQRDWPEGWDQVRNYNNQDFSGQATLDSAVHHGRTSCLCLQCTRDGQIAQVSQNVRVGGDLRPGGKYRLSAWVKSGGMKQSNGINVGILAPGIKSLGGGGRIPMPREAGGWVRGSTDVTIPQGAETLRIMIQLTGPGKVWVDDLTLSEVRPDGSEAELRQPAQPPDHAFMRQWVELFHGAGRPYLLLGKMVHPPQLKAATVRVDDKAVLAVLHNAYQAADGSVAAVLANATEEPQDVQLTWPGAAASTPLTLQPDELRLVRR